MILTSSVISTSISLLVTWGRDIVKDRRDRKSDAQDVARSLEAFVRRCAQAAVDADEAKPVARANNVLVDVNLPSWDLPSVSWKLWDHDLVDQVKAFQTTVIDAQHSMAREWDANALDEEMDYLHLIEKKAVSLGNAATEVARRVRSAFKLSTVNAEKENTPANEILKKARQFHADRDTRLWAEHNKKLDRT